MTTTAEARPEVRGRASFPSRVFGFGSIFGKTLRDSRRAMLLTGGFLVLIWLISGASIAQAFSTQESRAEIVLLTRTLPSFFLGLYGGDTTNVETLGGLANWRYGLVFFLFPAFWSILALSGTLVNEARRGSMEFVATTGISRGRIAVEKVAAHVAGMAIVMTVVALVTFAVGLAFGALPGDEIPIGAAFAYALVMGLTALAAGAVAFALAPFVGRGASAGIAALVMLAAWLVNGFRDSIPVFDSLSALSWYRWTLGHRPIAGAWDWASLVPVAVIVLAGLAVGVLAFARRDLGEVGSLRSPSLPKALLGVRGPFDREFGERFSGAIGWGLGIALYSLVIAASADALRDSLSQNPTILRLFQAAFPNFDLNQPGVALQLMFMGFGFPVVGLAAAALLSGWASDESDGRLEMLLATPRERVRWSVLAGLGVYAAIVLVTVIVAVGGAIGVVLSGDDPSTPVLGTIALTLFALAVAGIGLAVGGIYRPGAAAPAAVLVVLSSFLVDILVPAFRLPQEFRQLALTAHFGEPMLGSWDPVGIVLSLGLAIGGLLAGAWGFARRDIGR